MERTVLDLLRSHRTIGEAPIEELKWIAAHGTLRRFPVGEVVSSHDLPVEGLYIVITGRLSIHVNRPSGRRRMMEWRAGDVTGLLPYSRLIHPPGDTITDEPTEAVFVAREDLPALAAHCYAVTSNLVHEMTDRARRFTSSDLRDEKLTSLGKLAAGLAHELNNPASALIRDAKTLDALLTQAGLATRALWDAGLGREHVAVLHDVLDGIAGPPGSPPISGLELADREDAIAEWLDAHGLDDALTQDLARTSIDDDALARLAESIPASHLDAALRWIVASAGARTLVTNMERAASRIHSLVSSVKGFTHMDRGSELESIAIAGGLMDTWALVEGKARGKSVTVDLDIPPDLPPVDGYAVEINQVWMNLLDNAIDAAPPSGHVRVSARRETSAVVVTVADDGPGIPPEIGGKIFDPFFTTKDVGEGTGLGLDIVRRIVQAHRGEIDFSSQPGRTEFRVSIPIGKSR